MLRLTWDRVDLAAKRAWVPSSHQKAARPFGFPLSEELICILHELRKVNPNGSQGDVAGICDASGRVLGLMPHPERHVLPYQHPRWTREGLAPEGDGLRLFRNAVEHFL